MAEEMDMAPLKSDGDTEKLSERLAETDKPMPKQGEKLGDRYENMNPVMARGKNIGLTGPWAMAIFGTIFLSIFTLFTVIFNLIVAGQVFLAIMVIPALHSMLVAIPTAALVAFVLLISFVFPVSLITPMIIGQRFVTKLAVNVGSAVFGITIVMSIFVLPWYIVEIITAPIDLYLSHTMQHSFPLLISFVAWFSLLSAGTITILAFFQGLRAPKVIRLTVGLTDTADATQAQSIAQAPESESDQTARSVTIAHLTDLHCGSIRGSKWLDRVAAQTNALCPDIIAITGDLNDSDYSAFVPVAPTFAKFKPRLPGGLVACSGNHDLMQSPHAWLDRLTEAGVNVLCNEAMQVGPVNIAGVHDFTGRGDFKTDFKAALGSLDVTRPTILLQHQPAEVQEGDQNPSVRLILSGHTHNGQIWPFTKVVRLRYKHVHGAYTLPGGTRLVVGAGTGVWGPPVRVFTSSEIYLITLRW
ncbi:Calcineurin-like phosphoesterase [Carpediemonas membranifera]|uniref:Calcineurin-like phosphoesterase n=1 Tax=Carpediemonas membranifera TaxID=201153 RepID=A0A8J6AZD9_9EUKA|nr:Calcineurin-like phosphoesterase [Carpediemonas membranifera]|eukprot:KAG9390964.1 Calcineurin-like phosphoesterase [Carpediemonas membranifera]